MPLPVINLLTASPRDTRTLASLIGKNGGRTDLLVHPFYRVHGQDVPPWEDCTSDYHTALGEILERGVPGHSPLVILEERTGISRLAERLAVYGPGRLYVIPTLPNAPIPSLPHPSSLTIYTALKTVLRGLGVTEVGLGGIYFHFKPLGHWDGKEKSEDHIRLERLEECAKGKPHATQWLRKRCLPWGCAGSTAQELVQGALTLNFCLLPGRIGICPDHRRPTLAIGERGAFL